MIKGPAQSGFALADSLIALAVIAVMTGLLFTTLGSATRTSSQISDRRQAVMVAQSALALANGRLAAAEAGRAGRIGDYRWQIETAPYTGTHTANSVALERITVSVSREGETNTMVMLKSLRIAP